MRYFLSVGEPSGDIHGMNLIRAIRARDPAAEFHGFGGQRMESAGCSLLYPMADSPVMGLINVFRLLPKFIRLLNEGEAWLREHRPDALILIDNPGFNWHMAKRAKRLGIPVFYYVPPQIWAWLPRRVEKIRRFVDHVLCSLPFEEAWYHSKGIPKVEYVGHPFFDDLCERQVDRDFIRAQKDAKTSPIVALLPGSRTQEVKGNAGTLARSASKLQQKLPHVKFVVAAFKNGHLLEIHRALAAEKLQAEVYVGRTPEIIEMADAAIAVSGSVSLELLYHRVPTAIVYNISRWGQYVLRPLLIRTPFVTLVNLMAGRLLYPEFVGCRDSSTDIAETVHGWLTDASARNKLHATLGKLVELYATPGAGTKAARYIVDKATPAASRASAA
jgi:lipid-A-disaccharide synthase